MNGFDTVNIGPISRVVRVQYVDPAQIVPYWDLARQYVLADHMFQTEGSGSYTAHQDLIAGGTNIDPSTRPSIFLASVRCGVATSGQGRKPA